MKSLPQFSLWTLIVVMLLGGPAIATLWWWPSLRVMAGSMFIAMCIGAITLALRQWHLHRMQTRLATGKSSAAAVGVELSLILCLVVVSFLVVGAWVEYLAPLISK